MTKVCVKKSLLTVHACVTILSPKLSHPSQSSITISLARDLSPVKKFFAQSLQQSFSITKTSQSITSTAKMHLMYTLDAQGNRLYTLKKVAQGQVTKSAHPARFSPDDKWSRQRVTLKRRFELLLTQQSMSSTLTLDDLY